MIEPVTLLLLLGLGTWAALDGTSVGQVLISRPLVSATLAGFLLGDAATGLLVGVLLEGLYLGELPAGGVRLPEPGPPGVAAAVVAVQHAGPGGLAVGVALAAALSLLGGWTVGLHRQWNGRRIAAISNRSAVDSDVAEEGSGARAARRLARTHWTCVVLDAARGLLVTLVGVGLALSIPAGWVDFWPWSSPPTIGLLALPGLVSMGSVLRPWVSSTPRRGLLAAGFCGGLLVAILL